MRIVKSIKIVFKYMKENKKRSFLAFLGVGIGVLSLCLMFGITNSMKEKVNQEMAGLGSHLLIVTAGKLKFTGGRMRLISQATTLKEKEAYEIKEKILHVVDVAPFVSFSMPAHTIGGNREFLSVIGTTPNFFYIYNMKVKEGKIFSETDNRNLKRVMILGIEAYNKFFGNSSLKNQQVLLFNVPFKVIGKLDRRGTDISGNSLDNKAFIPIKTALKRMLNRDYIDAILILVDKEKNLKITQKEVEKYLFFKHSKKDFTVMPYSKLAATQEKTIKIFSKLAITISTISFFVGALGIFALMTISVYERFTEIGIRRAFGARKIDIILEFLLESFILSFLGAIFGVLIAILLQALICKIAHWPFVPYYKVIILSMLLSSFLGILAGVYPAIKASLLDPKKVLYTS